MELVEMISVLYKGETHWAGKALLNELRAVRPCVTFRKLSPRSPGFVGTL